MVDQTTLYSRDTAMDAIYTDTGQGNAKYWIVERYSTGDKYPDVHSYFFAITDTERGSSFHSPTTNGGKDVPKTNRQQGTKKNFTTVFINKEE